MTINVTAPITLVHQRDTVSPHYYAELQRFLHDLRCELGISYMHKAAVKAAIAGLHQAAR